MPGADDDRIEIHQFPTADWRTGLETGSGVVQYSGVDALLDVTGVAKDDEGAEHLGTSYGVVAAKDGNGGSNDHQRASSFMDVRLGAQAVAGAGFIRLILNSTVRTDESSGIVV